jgi:hypothetical protein
MKLEVVRYIHVYGRYFTHNCLRMDLDQAVAIETDLNRHAISFCLELSSLNLAELLIHTR